MCSFTSRQRQGCEKTTHRLLYYDQLVKFIQQPSAMFIWLSKKTQQTLKKAPWLLETRKELQISKHTAVPLKV